MSTLERKNLKVFGANADLSNIGQFGSAVAGTKLNTEDIEEIQELEAWTKGWESAAVSENRYPALQERNGIDKVFSYQIAYLLQEGIPTWNKDTEYSPTSIVKTIEDDKVVLYQSLTDNNINNPLTDETKWQKFSYVSEKELESYVNKSGDTMTGALVIDCNENVPLQIVDNRFEPNVVPNESLYSAIAIRGAGESNVSALEAVDNANGQKLTQIWRAKQDSQGTRTYARIGVGFDANGNIYTSAPACINTNAILTLNGWNGSTTGYIRLGMGLILQWGTVSMGNTITTTLPISFAYPERAKVFAMHVSEAKSNANVPSYEGRVTANRLELNSSTTGTMTVGWFAIGL